MRLVRKPKVFGALKGTFQAISRSWVQLPSEAYSLEPLIHKDTNVIEIVPESFADIHLGDLIAYKSKYSNGTILHRVTLIDEDEEGWFVIMKGDNNPTPDPGRIRFEQIQRIVVRVIY